MNKATLQIVFDEIDKLKGEPLTSVPDRVSLNILKRRLDRLEKKYIEQMTSEDLLTDITALMANHNDYIMCCGIELKDGTYWEWNGKKMIIITKKEPT